MGDISSPLSSALDTSAVNLATTSRLVQNNSKSDSDGTGHGGETSNNGEDCDWLEGDASCNEDQANNENRKRSPAIVHATEQRGVRALTVLDLPTDLLRIILSYFTDGGVLGHGNVDYRWRSNYVTREENTVRRHAVQSLRLTCRALYNLASPLLCPGLRVYLSQESLDTLEAVSRSPAVAAGVRGLQVVLQYRPAEVAEDLPRFAKHCKRELGRWDSHCGYYEETWYLGGYDTNDETICPLPHRVYAAAMEEYRVICEAWDAYVKSEDRDALLNAPLDEDGDEETRKDVRDYQHILRDGFVEYRQLHEEQHRLLMDGSFARTVAAAMARMPRVRSLNFVDEVNSVTAWTHEDPTLPFFNKQEIAPLLLVAYDWHTIQDLSSRHHRGAPPAKLLPARLLSELPVAIHRAGVKLRSLDIDIFPVDNNHDMLFGADTPALLDSYDFPVEQGPQQQGLVDALHAALASLTKFQFRAGKCRTAKNQFLPPEQQRHVNNYLTAALSSQLMEEVQLDCNAFGLQDNDHHQRRPRQADVPLGDVLSRVRWPVARDIRILRLSLHGHELEAMCRGLCGDDDCVSRLELLSLGPIRLLSGRWAPVLDLLRDLLGARCLSGACRVNLFGLTGAEFGAGKLQRSTLDTFGLGGSRDDDGDWWEEPSLVKLAKRYASGEEGMGNPLADWKGVE